MSEKQIKKYFFIDYENVKGEGLNGIVKLSEADCVRIYYSSSAETMTFGLHRRINASQAHFDYIKVQMPIKNAVDCQILFDIQDMVKTEKKAEYIIVSRDTDYDKSVAEFRQRDLKVKRVSEICRQDEPLQTQPEKAKIKCAVKVHSVKQPAEQTKREAQLRSYFGQHMKQKAYADRKEDIIQAVLTANSKQQINNNLMKKFSSEIVGEIYKDLKGFCENMPGK